MLTGRPIDVILRRAENFGLPKVDPDYPWIDGNMIAKLLTEDKLVATLWKECQDYKEVPGVAICMTSYGPSYEVGRCVLYHRNTLADCKTAQPYVVDPYPHADSRLYLRVGTAALAELPPAWFIGVGQMNKTAVK